MTNFTFSFLCCLFMIAGALDEKDITRHGVSKMIRTQTMSVDSGGHTSSVLVKEKVEATVTDTNAPCKQCTSMRLSGMTGDRNGCYDVTLGTDGVEVFTKSGGGHIWCQSETANAKNGRTDGRWQMGANTEVAQFLYHSLGCCHPPTGQWHHPSTNKSQALGAKAFESDEMMCSTTGCGRDQATGAEEAPQNGNSIVTGGTADTDADAAATTKAATTKAATKETTGNNGDAYCSSYCSHNWNGEMPEDWEGACCLSAADSAGEAVSCTEAGAADAPKGKALTCTCQQDDDHPFRTLPKQIPAGAFTDKRHVCD